MLDHIVIDTNIMPVVEDERHPGKKTQTLLSAAEMSGGVVRISFWPAGFTENIRKLIGHGGHRHYHRSVNERHYVLGGDWTILHWARPAEAPLRTRMYRHHYLENPPHTLHGITSDGPPVTGTKFLVWTSGPGTDIYEPAAKQESIDVAFDEAAPPEAFYNSPVLLNAEDISWTPHPQQARWLVKQLSRPGETLPTVTLVNVPAGTRASVGGLAPSGSVKHWLYLLSGDLSLEAKSTRGEFPVSLKEGGFLAWNAASDITHADGALTDGGCVALCVGHTLGRP